MLQGRHIYMCVLNRLSLTDTHIEINGNGTVPCVATGEPAPDISWTRKNGKQLNKSRVDATEHGNLQFTCKSF